MLFFLFILGLFTQNIKSLKNIFLLFSIIILAFTVAIRDGIGADYETYVNIYNEVFDSNDFFGNIIYKTRGVEYLFSFFLSAFKYIGFEKHYFFFFFLSIITLMAFLKAINNFNFKFSTYSLFIYYCFFFLNFHFNTVRHGVMVSFVWLAFSYIPLKDFKGFIKYLIIAILFHQSAIMFIPFYWILTKRVNKKQLILFGLIIVVSLFIPFFVSLLKFIVGVLPANPISRNIEFYLYSYYWESESTEKTISLGTLVYTMLIPVIYIKIDRFRKTFFGFDVIYNALIFSVVFGFVFRELGVFVERVSGVLNISLVFLLPILVVNYNSNKLIKILTHIIFVLYGALILNANLNKIERTGEFQFIPYKTIDFY